MIPAVLSRLSALPQLQQLQQGQQLQPQQGQQPQRHWMEPRPYWSPQPQGQPPMPFRPPGQQGPSPPGGGYDRMVAQAAPQAGLNGALQGQGGSLFSQIQQQMQMRKQREALSQQYGSTPIQWNQGSQGR